MDIYAVTLIIFLAILKSCLSPILKSVLYSTTYHISQLYAKFVQSSEGKILQALFLVNSNSLMHTDMETSQCY